MSNKFKPHKGLLKRVKVTASGRIVRKQAGKGHLMSSKTGNRRRRLGKAGAIAPSEMKRSMRMLARG